MDVLYIASILLTVHCCGIVGAAPVPATSVVSPWNNTATGNTGRVIQLIGTGDDDNSSGAASWSQVGQTLSRERVRAISMDFGPDGFPVYACGWDDGERGTRIPVMAWNGQQWIEVYHRTSQFPQGYHEFDFKARNNAYYLGLRVNNQYGSVLNGAVEYRGSYAFHNQEYRYDIEPNGDMVMLWISRAETSSYPGTGDNLVLVKYLAGGWTGYPGGNTFGPQTVIDAQDAPGNITNLRLKNGPAVGEYITAHVKARKAYVHTGSLAGLTLARTVDADTVNMAVERDVVCIAFHDPRGAAAVNVECADGYGSNLWRELGIAIEEAALVERLAVETKITDDGRVVVAARSAIAPNKLVVRWRAWNAPDGTVWTVADLDLQAPITHFEMGVTGNAVYMAVSEEQGQGLRVMQLVL